MLSTFRQGLIRIQTSPSFLSLGIGGVSLNASTEPTIVAFAQGRSDYLFTESESIPDAWVGPFNVGTNYELFWDIDIYTGKRTFGYTTVSPSFGITLPVSPVLDQHFFDLNDYKMKVWNGSTWKTKIRVFAGRVQNGTTLIPLSDGSQVNLNQTRNIGHILFDDEGNPVKRFDRLGRGEFLTTESGISSQTNLLNSYKLEALQISARAVEPAAKFHCLALKGPNRIGLASFLEPDFPCVGISLEDINKDEVRRFITDGFVTNTDWNFIDPPNTPIWVGSNGEITTSVPSNVSMQRIGHLVDNNTVFIDIQEIILINPIPASPTPTPSSTLTPTPTPSVTPSASVISNAPLVYYAQQNSSNPLYVYSFDGAFTNTHIINTISSQASEIAVDGNGTDLMILSLDTQSSSDNVSIHSYTYNGTDFDERAVEYMGSVTGARTLTVNKNISDNDNVYIVDSDGDLHRYTLDKPNATFNLVNTVTPSNVSGFVFNTDVLHTEGSSYLYVTVDGDLYAFDPITLNEIAFITSANFINRIAEDDNYVYISINGGSSTSRIEAYSFNGSAFILEGSITVDDNSSQGLWSDGSYIYYGGGFGGTFGAITAFTFDGSTFTPIDTLQTVPSASIGTIRTYNNVIYADGGSDGIYAFTFDGVTLTQEDHLDDTSFGADLYVEDLSIEAPPTSITPTPTVTPTPSPSVQPQYYS